MIYIPSHVGQLNRRALLRRLQKLGVASRADLAKSLGMSQPTAGKIVDEMLAAEVLEEVAVSENGQADTVVRGRPGRMLRLNQTRSRLVAVQLGLQNTTVAQLSFGAIEADEWHDSFSYDPADRNPARSWEKKLSAVLEKIKQEEYLGILLSVPGVVDEAQNRVLFSPNLHWTEIEDLVAIVGRVCELPVVLVQEERALALGHHFVNPECNDFLLVDFGEGVGGAIVVEGKPFTSPLPISGEIGHTPVLGNHRRCGCGAVGCMETLISLRGLLDSFGAAQRINNPMWNDLKHYLAHHGIPAWLAQSLEAAAVAISGSLNVLGLRCVVITGSLTELPPVVIEHLSRAVQNGSMWAKFGSVECIAAPRRRTAGLVAVGIDRFVVPDVKRQPVLTGHV